MRRVATILLVCVLWLAPALASAQEWPTGNPVPHRVLSVDLETETITVQPLAPDGETPTGFPTVLDEEDVTGRMESADGFPMTLNDIRPGARATIWFEDDGDVLWIVFPSL